MPYPEYQTEDLAFFIGFISMFMILSFAIIIPPLIKRIVHEKESGIKVGCEYLLFFIFFKILNAL